MIKFFNIIRQDLMEQNKTGKYFKYAIGEIILVVIGILIALQINNWNESRKYNQLKETYLQRLVNDIEQDTITINYIIDEIEITQDIINKLVKSIGYNTSEIELDSLFTNYFIRGWIMQEFIPTNNTYIDLSQTGNMNIIKNSSLVDKINEYYGYVKAVDNSNNVNKNWIIPLDLELAKSTAAFEIDPTTSVLFSHKNRLEALKDIQSHPKLIERNAAGHYWINQSLAGNLISLKGVCINLLKSLHNEIESL